MAQLGPPEMILILLVLILLFGAKKLPELARGSGRALRIFKAETKGLVDDASEGGSGPLAGIEEAAAMSDVAGPPTAPRGTSPVPSPATPNAKARPVESGRNAKQ